MMSVNATKLTAADVACSEHARHSQTIRRLHAALADAEDMRACNLALSELVDELGDDLAHQRRRMLLERIEVIVLASAISAVAGYFIGLWHAGFFG